jgi:hypothetical protein
MGNVWYVSADGDNGNTGYTPDDPLLTIGYAISEAVAGDAITVKAGTYDESGLDMNLDGLELWGEIGTIINNSAAGTVLTVSGDYCHVRDVRLTQAGQIGLHVTGLRGSYEDIESGPGNATSYRIDGTANALTNCHAGQSAATGFGIRANGTRLQNCGAIGAGGATRGFHVHNNAVRCRLYDCSSVGNGTSGFEIATGSTDCLVKNGASGSGDGRWIDADNGSVWSNFTFDDEVYHTTTFAGGGGGSDNIFKVSGCVEIHYIYGDVHTVLSADVDNIYLDLWDGTVSVEITDNGGGGTDTNSADVGSIFIKSEIATTGITLLQSNQGRVEENTSFRLPRTPFILNQKKDTNTYIRVVYSGVATSGAIHWHCKYFPLTEDGFVEAV